MKKTAGFPPNPNEESDWQSGSVSVLTGQDSPVDALPLCVDLDGTLLRVDTLQESLVLFLKQNPWRIWVLVLWLLRGRAYFKQQLAQAVALDFASLPVTVDFLEFLRAEHQRGRTLILATGADQAVALRAAAHFGIFSAVLASDGAVNLTGARKAARLQEKLGTGQFDYAGNSSTDCPVWEVARKPLFVNAPVAVVRRQCGSRTVGRVFGASSRLSSWAKALRLHQWSKNVLVLVPAISGHKLGDVSVLWQSALALLGFCFCASSVYILNDLGDLEADRSHPTKRKRPFAAGQLSPLQGGGAVPLLLGLSALCGAFLPPMFLAYLGVYFAASMLYSQVLKKMVLVDVFALAGLYTLRLLVGHGATGIRYSSWLMGFSMFLFLSLALLKRYIELHRVNLAGRPSAAGRDYLITDLPLLLVLGPLSGWLAALVLSLYISSEDVRLLYHHPLRLLFICPLLLYWISRAWLLATRNALHDDPVVFALKDRVSYVVGALVAFFVWLGTI